VQVPSIAPEKLMRAMLPQVLGRGDELSDRRAADPERQFMVASVSTRRRQEADVSRDRPAGQSHLAAILVETRSRK